MIPPNECRAGPGCPIRILPNELLAKIFEVGKQDWSVSSVAASILPFPVPICGVCKHWREVALNCPDLWSTIHVPVSSSATPITDSLSWVQAWIARSKSVPLTIVLDIPLRPCLEGLRAAVAHLTMMEHPIRRLDIRSNGINVVNTFFCLGSLQTSDYHEYEQISLCFPNYRHQVRFAKEDHVLQSEYWGSPDHMKKFKVSKLRVRGLFVYPPQFPNLTSLTAWEVKATFLELRDLFAESPSLTNLVLCRLRVSRASPSPEIGSAITLPSLRRLAVSFLHDSSTSNGIYPIRYLRLPNLGYLEVNGNSNVSLASAFKDSLSSADRLHTLKLFNFPHGIFCRQPRVGTNVDDLDDISFLRSLNSICHLHLIESAAAPLISSPFAEPHRLRRPSIGSLVQQQPQSRAGMLAELRQGAAQLQSLDTDKRKAPSKPSSRPFPNLQTITLDTLAANDLVDLCHYVGARKEKLEAVYLSTPAQRHLNHTLFRKPGDVTFRVPLPLSRKRDVGIDQANDADDWLRERVEVRKFDPASRIDLLEDITGETPPLSEMV